MPKNSLYKDHTVQIGESYLTIFKYYFPLATSKTIIFSDIQKVSIEDGIGAGQNWGTCSRYMNNWFPLDRARKHKLKFIAIHMKGRKIIPSFTPENPQKVFNLIYENFTEEGKRVEEYRLSQCGKQTQIAQQQFMERMKKSADQKVLNNSENKVLEKKEQSPSKRRIIKAEPVQIASGSE